MTDFEQQWAIALKKARQQAKNPIINSQRLIIEKINIHKNKLKIAIKKLDKIQIEKNYKTLIQLRASLCATKMLAAQATGYLDETRQNKLITDYAKDCLKLKNILNKFSKYN